MFGSLSAQEFIARLAWDWGGAQQTLSPARSAWIYGEAAQSGGGLALLAQDRRELPGN